MPRLAHIVETDPAKCIKCHRCISVCPVKFANEAGDDCVKVNSDRCIGCGQCISACEHGARAGVDDFTRFMADLERGVAMVAIVAPAVAANFPDRYLNLNGWLRSLGVAAVMDVSFGAELTVKSYLEHIKANNPACVISQPCPAIVDYIQIYKPELIPYLAPADSPMLHSMRMIRRYRPEYARHKLAVISPCLAKRREFDETGIGDYNVTMSNIKNHLETAGINLARFPEIDYDNPSAERAVLFSIPGGLMRTAERFIPGISEKIRKIEGPELIYRYLDELPEMIDSGKAPLIVDCLNCECGCNGGTGAPAKGTPVDELEHDVEARNREMRARYADSGKRWWRSAKSAAAHGRRQLDNYIDEHWQPGLYDRCYADLSSNAQMPSMSDNQRKQIMARLGKAGDDDMYNCSACGYNSCEKMIQAIHMGCNRSEHCYHVLLKKAAEVRENVGKIKNVVSHAGQAVSVSSQAMRDMAKYMGEIDGYAGNIGQVLDAIEDVAFQTNLLSLNAAVEAARAGESGKGFAVVADEVRNLAQRAAGSARDSRGMVENTIASVKKGVSSSQSLGGAVSQLESAVGEISHLAEQIGDDDDRTQFV